MNVQFITKKLNATISAKQMIGRAFKKACGRNYNAYLMFVLFLFEEEIIQRKEKRKYFNEKEVEVFLTEHISEQSSINFIEKKYTKELSPAQKSTVEKFMDLLEKFNKLSFKPMFTPIGESQLSKITKIYRCSSKEVIVWDEKMKYHPSELFV